MISFVYAVCNWSFHIASHGIWQYYCVYYVCPDLPFLFIPMCIRNCVYTFPNCYFLFYSTEYQLYMYQKSVWYYKWICIIYLFAHYINAQTRRHEENFMYTQEHVCWNLWHFKYTSYVFVRMRVCVLAGIVQVICLFFPSLFLSFKCSDSIMNLLKVASIHPLFIAWALK